MFFVQNEGVVLLVSFLDSTVAVFHWRWTKTSDEVKNYDFTKHFSQSLGYTENEIHSDYVGKNTEILKIIISITGGSLNTTSPTTPPSMVIIGPIEKLAGPYNSYPAQNRVFETLTAQRILLGQHRFVSKWKK